MQILGLIQQRYFTNKMGKCRTNQEFNLSQAEFKGFVTSALNTLTKDGEDIKKKLEMLDLLQRRLDNHALRLKTIEESSISLRIPLLTKLFKIFGR